VVAIASLTNSYNKYKRRNKQKTKTKTKTIIKDYNKKENRKNFRQKEHTTACLKEEKSFKSLSFWWGVLFLSFVKLRV